MTRAVLVGATGRMGRSLARTVGEFPGFLITGAIASAQSEHLGRDFGELCGVALPGVAVRGELEPALAEADVVVDFSQAAALPQTLRACAAHRRPLLVGTTGLSAEIEREIERATAKTAVLVAANTSLGIAVLTELARHAARLLPPEAFDVTIREAHHRHKRDAPSGTALALASAIDATREGVDARHSPDVHAVRERREAAGFAVTRGGDIVGEHEVLFAGPGEQLALRHVATDRAIFARGAWAAARWLVGRPPGRYAMADVLGLKIQ